MVRRTRRNAQPALAHAVAYLRVSTGRQELGPEAQRAAIEAWAKATGAAVVSWHEDRGISGATPVADRPALMAALDELKSGRVGVLVVAKRDRLARDPIIAAVVDRMAKDAGGYVLSADGVGNGAGPADKFMRRMVDAAAEYERELIRARTKAALQTKKARGERTGSVPYGYKVGTDGVHLEPDATEQRVIARAHELDAAGHTLRAITAQLNAEGCRNRRGQPFAFQSVHRMLHDDRSNEVDRNIKP